MTAGSSVEEFNSSLRVGHFSFYFLPVSLTMKMMVILAEEVLIEAEIIKNKNQFNKRSY